MIPPTHAFRISDFGFRNFHPPLRAGRLDGKTARRGTAKRGQPVVEIMRCTAVGGRTGEAVLP